MTDASAAGTAAPASGHLHEVDVVRLLTVGAVIAVHGIAFAMAPEDAVGGGLLTLLHVSREVFLLLSAFVLAYSYRIRPMRRRAFWRRRYPLVVLPYVTWTAIYLVASGRVASPWATTSRFLSFLADGGAQYHLYFLLVMLQLYAVFPWLLAALRRGRDHHVAVLAASAAVQVAIAAAVHYRVSLPGVLGAWLADAGIYLPSYEFYVVAGVIAALHLDQLTRWCRSHARLVGLGVVLTASAGVASYLVDLDLRGLPPGLASEVFQPVVIAESVAFTIGLLTLGLWLSDRAGTRVRAALETSSDLSFGVYLVHPLVLQIVLLAAARSGLTAAWLRLPSGALTLLILAVLVPFVYLTAAGLVALARRTPLSLPLSGRAARRPTRRLAATPYVVVPTPLEETAPAVS